MASKKKFSVNAPKKVTFWISLALGLLGVIGAIIPAMATFAPWILALGWLLLTLGCFVKGL